MSEPTKPEEPQAVTPAERRAFKRDFQRCFVLLCAKSYRKHGCPEVAEDLERFANDQARWMPGGRRQDRKP